VTSFSANKTMLASKNLIPPCTTPEGGLHWIDLLAGELNVRLLEARELAPGLWPKTLVLAWRTGYGYGNNMKSRQAPFGYTKHLSLEYIAKAAKRLWREACPGIVRAKGGMDVHSVSTTLDMLIPAVTHVFRGRADGDGPESDRGLPRYRQTGTLTFRAAVAIRCRFGPGALTAFWRHLDVPEVSRGHYGCYSAGDDEAGARGFSLGHGSQSGGRTAGETSQEEGNGDSSILYS
jgi:hypothetical protein